MEYHPHSGFHYCKLLKYLCYDYGTFINISGINLDGNEYRQVSIYYLYSKKRNIKNLICVTSVFFALTVYFLNNPLSEFCYIHLTLLLLADTMKSIRNYFNCN